MRLRWVLLGLVLVALLVPALMVTGSRIGHPEDGRLVRLVAFTPYALVLYAAAFLLLLVAVIAGRGFWRRVVGWSLIVVLLLAGLHAWWLQPLYLGDQPEAEGELLQVMTANLQRGGADPARVMEVVAANGVDVLVLSEVTPVALDGFSAAGIDEVLTHSVGNAAPGVDGTMLFSRYEMTGVERLATVSGGYAVEMVTPQLGPIRFVGVHASPPFGDADDWRADHEEIFDYVESIADDTVLVAGDLNATPDHEPMGRLREIGMRSAAARANSGLQPTWPSPVDDSFLGVGVPSVIQIDHVLLDGSVVAVDTQTVTVDGTDHRALVTTLAAP